MNKILVVEHIHQAGEAMLARKAELVYPQPQNVEGILAAIGDCNALVVRNTKITRRIMEAAPRLAVIGRHGVGYDTVDIGAATDLGIPVVYTPAANTESVAEIAVGFIICLCRKIIQAHGAMQSEELLSDTVTLPIMTKQRGLVNTDLWGKTLGVIGVGRIGSSVSRKVTAAFNMRVLGYDPYVDAEKIAGCRRAESGPAGGDAAPVRLRDRALLRRRGDAAHHQRKHPGLDETGRLFNQHGAGHHCG